MKIKTIIPILILAGLAILLITAGCKKKAANSQEETISEVPPSVSGEGVKGSVFVNLSNQEAQELNVPVAAVTSQITQLTLSAPATVYPAPNHIGIISAPVDGRILNLPLQEGDNIARGQVIMELESLTFGTLVAEYLQAMAEVELQENQLARFEKLVEKKISPEAELERVKADHTRASASVNAAYSKLKTVGVSDSEIESFKSDARINPRLKIHSPITGVIDSHKVELGQSVAAGDQLATVINLDQLLVKAFLSPEDGILINRGDSVRIGHRLIDEAPLKATVTTINPGLDEDNRSLVVNIILKLPRSLLKPGDNVRAEIITNSQVEVVTVPMDAVTYDNNDPVVFVKSGSNVFEMRRIKIREIKSGFAIVEAGLKPGEEVATGQVFSLKALSRFKLISEE